MSHTYTKTYTICKPRHLVRRTARIHAAILNRRWLAEFPPTRRPLSNRYEVKDLKRGPFRWAVVDWGAR